MIYHKETAGVSVSVTPLFLNEGSRHEDQVYMWAYSIHIKNNQDTPLCLRRRFWQIIDASGHSQQVEGEGVLGEQPLLEPGKSYEYASGTMLSTPSGVMLGRYQMETQSGEHLKVEIPAFYLESPYNTQALH